MQSNHRNLGEVTDRLGRTLVSPLLNLREDHLYFGEVKRFPEIKKMMSILGHGVPVDTTATAPALPKALAYDVDSSVKDHLSYV